MTVNYQDLGLRVRDARKAKHLTQEQLAEKVGISSSFMGHIERGTRIASIDTLVSICNVLSVSPCLLLGASLSENAVDFPYTNDNRERSFMLDFNISRISTLNLKDTRNYMASENVFSVAKKLKLWDGKEPFKFWKAYGGPNYFGKMQAFSIREFFILSTLAPSLKLSMDDEELPLSVKPEKKISNADVMAYLRQTYEGTEWSVTKNLKVAVKDRKTGKTDTITSPRANPWMRTDEVQLFNALQKGAVTANRNVAVPQCAYSTVIQLRDWLPDAVGGVCWFGMDNPGQSPRVPIFCGTTDLPEMFKICGNHRYRLDAALWHYRQANKLATVRWGNARKILEKNLLHFERKGLEELPMVEQRYAELVKSQGEEAAKAYLTDYTKDFIGATLLRWDEMTAKYWNDYRFGF